MAIQIKIRRDTAANWTSADPILALGEPALETDTAKEKIGDGTTAWTSLPYKISGVSYTGSSSEDYDIFYADNYATLQLAIDAMPARGGTLILSAKDYVLTTTLDVDKPIIIQGQGATDTLATNHVTKITTTSGTIDMIEFLVANIVMRDLTLVNTHALPTAGTGIKVSTGIVTPSDPTLYEAGFRLDNVFIIGFYDNIHITNSFGWVINNIESFSAVRYGIYVQNLHLLDGGDCVISNSQITTGSRTGTSGVYQTSSGGLKIHGCKFNGPFAWSYDGAINNDTVVLLFSNCSFENFATGAIRVADTNNVVISGCQFASYTGGTTAIDIDNVLPVSIVGNSFKLDTTDDGISITNSQDITLLNAFDTGSGAELTESGNTNLLNLNKPEQTLMVAFSDETTAITAGTGKVSFQMPNYATVLTGVAVNFRTAPTTSAITLDVNEAGVSLLSTKITCDAGEYTSETAATPPVISDSALAANAIITVDVDTADTGGTSAGGKLILYYRKS